MTLALVMGGGGIAGIAWHTGVLLGLSESGADPSGADMLIASRLVGDDWPNRPRLVLVVEATTGMRRVLGRSSGVDLVDAVAASSAVPGVWPPVTLDGARYIDGGVWSLTNSDLASGHDRVLVLAPIVDPSVAAELAGLGPAVRTQVVRPDAGSLEAFGSDVLDPAVREPLARAGLAQGRVEADRVRELLAD
jgi:NTE family protein